MKYQLFNETDQLFASPEVFGTRKEATACANRLRQRFVAQGYYLAASGVRIRPDEVKFVIVPASGRK